MIPATHDNPVRGPLNAVFFDWMEGYLHYKFGPAKQELFADLPSRVVEIGPGAGANLRYLRPGTRLVAIEPNVHMHPALRRNADKAGIELELHASTAEQLSLPDASESAVIASLVLCTVDDPERVLSEVRRVLRPGGRFICIEHVEARSGTAMHTLQHAIREPWRWAFEGCDLCRDTGSLLERAGFRDVRLDAVHMDTIFVPIRPQIVAMCTR